MNYHYFLAVLLCIGLMVLTGCGSSISTQPVTIGLWTFDIADSYVVVPSNDGAQTTYRAGSGDNISVVQVSQSYVDSGIAIKQMASLNLQKLELSLPGYEFVEQSSHDIDCTKGSDGELVSFITQDGNRKLFHSQYYTITDNQGYVWSVSSTTDITRKILTNIIKSASCE